MKRVVVRRVRSSKPRLDTASSAGSLRIIDNDVIKRFNPSLLELGDISLPSMEREALAAIFDLTGFTRFCNQVDAYLAIPQFLSEFLEWFFESIRKRITEKTVGNRTALWAELPVKVKFLGDGLLIIWNAHRMTDETMCRLAVNLYDICRAYRREFFPVISMKVNKPPVRLRCGVARGKVFTVGNGNDYVGHCINNASRLSHLYSLSFAFPHRGFPVQEYLPPEIMNLFVAKYVSIRGIGENELVWIVKTEFEKLPEAEKIFFRDQDPTLA